MRPLVAIAVLLAGLAACGYPEGLPDWSDEVPIEGQAAPCANPREVNVACVIDGDTFDGDACGEDFGERFRLLGIDAPEVAHDGVEADCYGDIASAELTRVLEARTVTVSFDTECTGVYGRTLAYVWLDGEPASAVDDETVLTGDVEGELINETLLREGFVRLYEEDWVDDLRLQQRLEDAEAEAKALGLGLWSACDEE